VTFGDHAPRATSDTSRLPNYSEKGLDLSSFHPHSLISTGLGGSRVCFGVLFVLLFLVCC